VIQTLKLGILSSVSFDGVFSRSSTCLFAFFFGLASSLALPRLPVINEAFFIFIASGLAALCFTRVRPIAFLLLGFVWMCLNVDRHIDNSFPDEFERKDLGIVGAISTLPVSTDGNIRFRFTVESFDNSALTFLNGQTIQLSCYRCKFDIRVGQRWRLTVRLKRPHGYASWGAFDYEKYLFRHKLIAKGYLRLKSENRRLSEPSMSVNHWRESIKDRLLAMSLAQQAKQESVGTNIILALTIGVKTGFSHSQQRVLQTAGVSHLMAISGLHIGLVSIVVSKLFQWLLWPFSSIFKRYPRQQICLIPALAVAMSYAAMAGFSVSTHYVACNFFAREVSLSKVLLIAIFLLLIFDPFSVLDVGFWLSCGAVAVIAWVSNESEKLSLIKLQPMLWVGMMPLSVMFFSQVSFVSPFINLIAVPLFCLVLIPLTLFVFLLMVLGANGISAWCFSKLERVYEWIFQMLEVASQHSYAKVYSTPLVWWQWSLLIALALLCLPHLKMLFKRFPVFRSGVALSTFVALLISILAKPVEVLKPDEVHIALLDVGQGLAMVIETPNSVTVYDTGPRYGSGFTTADAVLLPYLRRRGVSMINTLIISHADNDHIGGLSALTDAFEVGLTLTSRIDKVPNGVECKRGQKWQHDQTQFSVLSPDDETPNGSNNLSCVILLEHYGKRVLLSGDIEKQVERYLVRTIPESLAADFLLVPHQGSKTSSTASFLDSVSPKVAMLAAGYKNHYGHPHPNVVERYLERDIELLSTIDSGSVLLSINRVGFAH